MPKLSRKFVNKIDIKDSPCRPKNYGFGGIRVLSRKNNNNSILYPYFPFKVIQERCKMIPNFCEFFKNWPKLVRFSNHSLVPWRIFRTNSNVKIPEISYKHLEYSNFKIRKIKNCDKEVVFFSKEAILNLHIRQVYYLFNKDTLYSIDNTELKHN